jgi:hypothetical protein
MREARLDQWVSAFDEVFPVAMQRLSTAELIVTAGHDLDDRVQSARFDSLGPGAERHGVWQWSAHARIAGLQRYVIVQVEMDASDQGDATSGECGAWVLAAASNTVHFASRLVSHRVLDDVDGVRGFIFEHAFEGGSRAVSLTPADLEGTYVDPRAMRRWRNRG